MYIPKTNHTNQLHVMIDEVCNYLRTSYVGKKHGGFNIFNDGKLNLSTDTFVNNVSADVILPDGSSETVFSCSHMGDVSCYHPGKWEQHLEALSSRAMDTKMDLMDEKAKDYRLAFEKANAPASQAADAVFS